MSVCCEVAILGVWSPLKITMVSDISSLNMRISHV